MSKRADEALYDVRLIERHIRNGRLSRKQVESHLADLEDKGNNADNINLEKMLTGIRGGEPVLPDHSSGNGSH